MSLTHYGHATDPALLPEQIRERWQLCPGSNIRLFFSGRELQAGDALPPQAAVVHCVVSHVTMHSPDSSEPSSSTTLASTGATAAGAAGGPPVPPRPQAEGSRADTAAAALPSYAMDASDNILPGVEASASNGTFQRVMHWVSAWKPINRGIPLFEHH